MDSSSSASPDTLDRELRGIFGTRMRSLVAYQTGGTPARTLAVVDSLTEQDLRSCAGRMSAWHTAGFATPLLVVARELARALDAFPLEFDAIAADHVVVSGESPFAQARVAAQDLRRACEVQARSHLLHLREGFLEAGGNSHALAVLIVDSAAPLNALLTSVGRLEGRTDRDPEGAARHAEHAIGVTTGLAEIARLVQAHEIAAAEAERLFPPYLSAVEKLVDYVDGWAAHGR
jgi:hypothetical protein